MLQILQSFVAGLFGALFKEPAIQSLLLSFFVLLLCGFFGATTHIQGYGKRALSVCFGLNQQSFCIEVINYLF